MCVHEGGGGVELEGNKISNSYFFVNIFGNRFWRVFLVNYFRQFRLFPVREAMRNSEIYELRVTRKSTLTELRHLERDT